LSITERFENFIDEELCDRLGCEYLQSFKYLLNRFSADSGTGEDVDTNKIDGLVYREILEMFPANISQLKFILTIAFNRRIFHAAACEKEVCGVRKSGIITMQIRSGDHRPLDKKFWNEQRTLEIQSLVRKIFGCGGRDMEPVVMDIQLPQGENDDKIHINFPQAENKLKNQFAEGLKIALQFFDHKKVLFKLGQSDFIFLYKPHVSNMVDWVHLTTVTDSRNKCRRATIPVRFSYKHPVGWMAASEKSPADYWAVASCIQGFSTTPDKRGKSSLVETRADFVTILPTSRGGSSALIFLLIALPFRSGLEAMIDVYDDMRYNIRKLCIDGKWFAVNVKYPITDEILKKIASIRHLISLGTFTGPDTGGSLEASLDCIKSVIGPLRKNFNALREFCMEYYDKEKFYSGGNPLKKIVKLIDVARGPHLVTCVHSWLGNKSEITTEGGDLSDSKAHFFSDSENDKSNPTLSTEALITGSRRMRVIGFSIDEIRSKFPYW
jgi:hypothetical protein